MVVSLTHSSARAFETILVVVLVVYTTSHRATTSVPQRWLLFVVTVGVQVCVQQPMMKDGAQHAFRSLGGLVGTQCAETL